MLLVMIMTNLQSYYLTVEEVQPWLPAVRLGQEVGALVDNSGSSASLGVPRLAFGKHRRV